MWRQRTGSMLCPGCGQLVGVNDERCLNCGRANPGLFGFAPLLRQLGGELWFTPLVMWTCGALYLSALAVDWQGIEASGLLSLFSPSNRALFVFGASGAIPVFRYDRWWTVLSAGWLHAGVLHIGFNMMAVRNLLPPVVSIYGPSRAVILYTVAGVAGFAASSAAGAWLSFLPRVLGGGGFTVGASAAICGLIGAIHYYGRRGGSVVARDAANRMLIWLALFGFMVPGIDNWAHLGGFVGGWLVARWLDPMLPERGDHGLWALVCLVASGLSVVWSIVTGLPLLR
jgi:rhomboid protease GluP